MDPWLIVFGFGVGILVGTTGMGGGSLMTPLLILVFGIQPVVAVGSDLAYAAITKTAGGLLHFRRGTVQTNLAWWLAAGSCPGAVAGVMRPEASVIARPPTSATASASISGPMLSSNTASISSASASRNCAKVSTSTSILTR